MALRVWLPLNGTLENKGISNYTINMFRGTETYNNNGKIGKCFYANGVNTIKILNIIPDFYNYTGYSLCAWFYIEAQNTTHSGAAIISAGNWNNQVLNLAVSDWSTDHYTVLRISGTSWSKLYSYTFNTNTWYHVVVSSDGNKTYAYVNGTLINDTAPGFLPTEISGNDICIGGATYYAGMQFFGRINDVRIYDHCLSAKEVKEISQGLILHYKLDSGYTESTINYLAGKSETFTSWGHYGFSSNRAVTVTEVDIEPAISGKVAMVTNAEPNTTNVASEMATVFYSNQTTIMNKGDKFTASCYVKGNGSSIGKRVHIHLYNTNGTNTLSTGKDYILTDEWQRITYTLTWTYDNPSTNSGNCYAVGYISTNESFYVSNWQVEKKDHATPYTSSSREGGVVVDSSGYGHYGITGNSPAVIPDDDSRFKICTQFISSSNQYIRNDVKTQSNYPRDEITVSWWGYMDSWSSYSRAISCTESGGWNFEPASGAMRWAVGTGASSNTYITTCTSTTTLANLSAGWHHFVGTYDGFSAKIYIDGVLEKTITSYTTKTPLYYANTYILIGCEATTGSGNGNTTPYFNGKLSDIRIYATALSENDIKELYQIPANIDNLNNAHAFEFIEDNNVKIEKTGAFKNRWSEGLELKKLQDGSIWAKLYYFDYDVAGAIWTPQEAKWCNKTGKYSCLGDLEKFVPTDGWYEFWYTEKTDASQYIQWKQSYNPLSRVSSGSGGTSSEYQFIGGTARSNFTGLTRYSNNDENSCYLRGIASWWGAIAPYQTSYDVFPTMWGSSTTGNHHQELWIKITDNANISRLTANSLSLGMIEK